jgi:hypothetical protein
MYPHASQQLHVLAAATRCAVLGTIHSSRLCFPRTISSAERSAQRKAQSATRSRERHRLGQTRLTLCYTLLLRISAAEPHRNAIILRITRHSIPSGALRVVTEDAQSRLNAATLRLALRRNINRAHNMDDSSGGPWERAKNFLGIRQCCLKS